MMCGPTSVALRTIAVDDENRVNSASHRHRVSARENPVRQLGFVAETEK
jgi:hypothetical protein